ncbi:DUF4342 domain-containing protein [Clostridium sp. DL1XJH146]
MTVKLQEIDLLRERTKATYEEAKEALEKKDGDLVEALVYLEKKNGLKRDKYSEKEGEFKKQAKSLLKKLIEIEFIVHRSGKTVINVPILILLLATIADWPFVIVGLIVALFTGNRIKFTNKNKKMGVSKVFDSMSNVVDSFKKENKRRGKIEEKREVNID